MHPCQQGQGALVHLRLQPDGPQSGAEDPGGKFLEGTVRVAGKCRGHNKVAGRLRRKVLQGRGTVADTALATVASEYNRA